MAVRLLLGVIAYNLGILLRRLALLARHSELVADEPPTAALQNRRTPDPAWLVLRPVARREPLDITPVWTDSLAHRAARMASDVIAGPPAGVGSMSIGGRKRFLRMVYVCPQTIHLKQVQRACLGGN